jgi:hypothetical protein
MALLANLHRDPKKRKAFTPGEFNPHEQKVQGVIKGKGIRILRDVFCKPYENTSNKRKVKK